MLNKAQSYLQVDTTRNSGLCMLQCSTLASVQYNVQQSASTSSMNAVNNSYIELVMYGLNISRPVAALHHFRVR
jgi:hypothetical protein